MDKWGEVQGGLDELKIHHVCNLKSTFFCVLWFLISKDHKFIINTTY